MSLSPLDPKSLAGRLRVTLRAFAMAAVVAAVLNPKGARSLAAQQIVPGLRVRSWVTPRGEWHSGTLVRFGPDSLVIQRCPECAAEAQPWGYVTRVEVSEGYTSSGRGIAIGALAGGVLAAVIHAQKVKRDVSHCNDGPCGLEAIEIPIAGLFGAGGGAVLGALWRVENWREIYGSLPAQR